MALDRLRASLKDCPVVRFGEYEYFVHPITDGIPLGRPEVLDEVLGELAKLGDWAHCDKIVTAESMGFPLAAGLSLRVHRPYVFIRKRQYGLPGEVSLKQTTGYSKTDMFINTNHIDNAPVAVLEACAMGLPVVSTNVGGIPNLLTDGETALLVPDDDDCAMADAIRSLLNDPGLAARLSAQGRLLAERSSWEKVRPQWERIFSHMMKPEFVPNRKRSDQGTAQQAEP